VFPLVDAVEKGLKYLLQSLELMFTLEYLNAMSEEHQDKKKCFHDRVVLHCDSLFYFVITLEIHDFVQRTFPQKRFSEIMTKRRKPKCS
jgi:hypothetical protein